VVGSEVLKITATQNPNSLTCNGHTIDRESLVKKLRLNYEAFKYAIIIPQFGDHFFDLSPGEKLTLFSSIMDLDSWLEKSEKAKEIADEIELKKQTCENEVFQLNGKLLSVTTIITELQAKSKEWADNQAERIKKVKLSIDKNLQSIKEYDLNITEFDKVINNIFPETDCYENTIKKQTKLISNLDDELTEVAKELAVIEHKIITSKDSQRRFEKVGSTCPTCLQRVDENHLISKTNKFKKEIKEFMSVKTNLALAHDEINSEKSMAIMSVSKVEAELSQLRTKKMRASNNRDASINEIKYLDREITRLELEIDQIKKQKNEFAGLFILKQEECIELHKKIEMKELKISELNEEFAAVNFWVSGFKRLRLFIVEETLRALEIEINNNLAALGLVNWTITFDIERENKSGSITKGFNVLINDPTEQAVKYESLSGGEGQRVRLAGAFGLANLITERAGLSNRIEFFDEISQHMSDEGIEDMLNSLRDRAVNYDKQIWVVDHHALDYADFNGGLTVIKDKSGSKLV
jgi:DNA repair exonuclease SbcCD ATPase subunit